MSILILCVIITAATVAQITEYAKTGLKLPGYVNTDTVRPTLLATHETELKKVQAVAKHSWIPARQKMMDDMSGIKGKKEPEVAMITKTEPVPVMAPINNKQALTDKQKAELDQIQAVNDEIRAKFEQDQAMKEQANAKLVQERAINGKEEADKDQAMAKLNEDKAMKNHALAKLYQALAKKDQEQAMKEKANADASK